MPELLLEVGTAELPAGFIDPALDALKSGFLAAMDGLRLSVSPERVRVEGTPRRLVLSVRELPAMQERQERVVHGPPARAAFDADGNPTQAALGFAKRQGADASSLYRVETDKGEYVAVTLVDEPRPTTELLAELLPELLAGLRFPKSMRWCTERTTFARPVHWLVAVFDGEVVPFEFAGLQSSNRTRGHRFLAPVEFDVTDYDSHVATLHQARVVLERAERRALIEQQLEDLANQAGGKAIPMPDLVQEVMHLVEWPHGILGRFDEALLELPREVLVSEMVEHQRYFPLESPEGSQLLPAFVAVSNTPTDDDALVARGYARVLAARFDDARFFYAEDRKQSLGDRIAALGGVIFQKQLGTLEEKVGRVEQIGLWLCEQLQRPELATDVSRATKLAKADLTTLMVGEFPELQGIMGEYYARHDAESEAVATAIREHYLPRGAGDDLPSTDVGAIVGIADRLDTLAGIIGIGKGPTGSADPYALRRAALGVIRIVLHRGFRVGVGQLAAHSVGQVANKLKRPTDEVTREVSDFLRTRFQGVLAEKLPTDVADAVIGDQDLDFVDADQRGRALARFRDGSEFEPCAVAFKRVANITRGQAAAETADVNPALFEGQEERSLYEALQTLRTEVEPKLEREDYTGAMELLSGLRPTVDQFFENVFVMVDDDAVKQNRMRLLSSVSGLFGRIADFTRLSV